MLMALCLLLFTSFTPPYKGSGVISTEYIRHKTNSKYIFRISEDRVRIFFRARSNDLSKAYIYYRAIDDSSFSRKELKEIGSTRGKQYFYIDLLFPEDNIEYYFVAQDKRTKQEFRDGKSNFKFVIPSFHDSMNRELESLNYYQVMVDRFRNGNPNNSSNISIWNSSWTSFTEEENKFQRKNSWYTIPFNRRYGGDLFGVIEQMGYIKSLGVDVLVLTPIFLSNSNHKNDVLDHGKLSPELANFNLVNIDEITKEQESEAFEVLKYLCANAKSMDMKVVVEFPLHVSREHFAFKDLLSNGNESIYREWFIESEDSFSSVDPNGLVVKLNHSNREVREYLLSSLKKLEEAGVDGVLVNTVNEKEILEYINRESALFIAALPFSLTDSFNSNEKIDAIFNHKILIDILNILLFDSISPNSSLKTTLMLHSLRYPQSFVNRAISSISSVDQERAISAVLNMVENNVRYQENRGYKRINPAAIKAGYLEVFKKAISILSILSSSLMISYGDEVGMWGASDPDSRKPMIWEEFQPYQQEHDDLNKYKNILSKIDAEKDEVNQRIYYDVKANKDLRELFTRLLSFRSQNRDMFTDSEANFIAPPFEVQNDVFIIERTYKGKSMLVIINVTGKSVEFNLQLKSAGIYRDLITDKVYESYFGIDKFKSTNLNILISQ